MTETKSTGLPPYKEGSAGIIPSPAGIPADPESPQALPSIESLRLAKQVDEKEIAPSQGSPAPTEAEPTVTLPKQSKKPFRPGMIWVLLPAILLLLTFLAFLVRNPQKKIDTIGVQTDPLDQEVKSNPRDYTAAISKNLLSRETKYSETVLTDDAFAGQAPRQVKVNGPVISQEIDPQLAALTDAFRKRLEIFQGSRIIVRGNGLTRISKGEFRGFKISAIEKIENQNVVYVEITVMTPKRGLIKSVNRVLEMVKETDFSQIGMEIQNAGLEYLMLPAQPTDKTVRVQLRSVRFLDKPVAHEWLISGKSVGGITLGMPIAQVEKLFVVSHIVLKRKILVKDAYFDVYKVLDQSNDPLFYVYENKGKVWGISLISEAFKTEKGIGIGSSLGTLRINYSQIKLGYSEKRTPFVQLAGIAGLFILQGEGIDFFKNVFPNENKVISILIGDSPDFE